MAQLDQTIQALEIAQKRVSHNSEHSHRLGDLISFLQQFRKDFPIQTAEQAFERIQTLRQWLFWLPSSLLRGGDTDLYSLAILAQFFAVGVALGRFFPEVGSAYMEAISVGPIEEICRILAAHNASDPFNAELRLAVSLLDLPHHIVARYRSLLGWSPQTKIEHYSPGPPSPYHALSEYPLASSSSPVSASTSYAAYTPPLHSPPAVTVAGSPFQLQDGYFTTAPSHALFPPSPQLVDSNEAQVSFSDFSQAGNVPPASAYTPPYGGDGLCANLTRDGSLGVNLNIYPPHSFDTPGMVTPETCWT